MISELELNAALKRVSEDFYDEFHEEPNVAMLYSIVRTSNNNEWTYEYVFSNDYTVIVSMNGNFYTIAIIKDGNIVRIASMDQTYVFTVKDILICIGFNNIVGAERFCNRRSR